jgi:hypothetical protein
MRISGAVDNVGPRIYGTIKPIQCVTVCYIVDELLQRLIDNIESGESTEQCIGECKRTLVLIKP